MSRALVPEREAAVPIHGLPADGTPVTVTQLCGVPLSRPLTLRAGDRLAVALLLEPGGLGIRYRLIRA